MALRIHDFLRHAAGNLRRKRLRTFLTAAGITIGIGALFCMLAFGQGVQRNFTEVFEKHGLFSYVYVSPPDAPHEQRNIRHRRHGHFQPSPTERPTDAPPPRPFDTNFFHDLVQLPGVDFAFPEDSFPAYVRYQGQQQLTTVQVLPPAVLHTDAFSYDAGLPYTSPNQNAVVVPASLLSSLGVENPTSALGQSIEIVTVAFDPNSSPNPDQPLAFALSLLANRTEPRSFPIVGIVSDASFSPQFRLLPDHIYLPPGPAADIPRLPDFTQLFASAGRPLQHQRVVVRLSSLRHLDEFKATMDDWGLDTLAVVDLFEDVKREFIYLDLFLFAIAMIAISVSALGIINTMTMSVLERYREIGVMIAVGATRNDIRTIFSTESALLGLIGGLAGALFGYLTSLFIQAIVHHVMTAKGVEPASFFHFPLWLWLTAPAFAVLISLAAGLYPAHRAARTNPIKALRHD